MTSHVTCQSFGGLVQYKMLSGYLLNSDLVGGHCSTLSDRWSPIVESDGRRTNVHKVTKRGDSKRPVTREESIVRGRKSGRSVQFIVICYMSMEGYISDCYSVKCTCFVCTNPYCVWRGCVRLSVHWHQTLREVLVSSANQNVLCFFPKKQRNDNDFTQKDSCWN